MSLFFLHIEKCGGMSLRKIIYELFKNKYENIFIQNYDGIHDESSYDIEYVLKKKIVDWHSFYDSRFDIYDFKITCIRNPVFRLLSHYHYFDKKKYNYKNLIEFENKDNVLFNSYVKSLGNLQIIKICGYKELNITNDVLEDLLIKSKNNIDKYTYVLQLESLNEDLIKLEHLLKKKFKNLNKMVIFNENKTSEKYMDYYSLNDLNKYASFCKYDIQLYNYVCDLKKNNLHIL